jgi:hypothetical protein
MFLAIAQLCINYYILAWACWCSASRICWIPLRLFSSICIRIWTWSCLILFSYYRWASLDLSIFSFSSAILSVYSCSQSYAQYFCTRKAFILSSFLVRSCNFSFASLYYRFFRLIISFFSTSHCLRDSLRIVSQSLLIIVCLLFTSLRAYSYFLSRSSNS